MATESIWSPLSTVDGETRVIVIEPAADFDADMRCSLHKISLNDNPYYCAVSYACGDPNDRLQVIVNNMPFMVVKSLVGAMRQFRSMGATMALWMDAISIDQLNSEERAQQIRLMSRIYNQAHQVCVWLGPPSEHSELGLGLLGAYTDPIVWAEANVKSPELARECVLGLRDILDRTWWSRLWTIQELLLGRQAGFMCGNLGFDSGDLTTVHRIGVLLTFLQTYGLSTTDHQSLLTDATIKIGAIHQLRDLGARSRSAPDPIKAELYRFILDFCRDRKATVPVDKIFGVLGLCPKSVVDAMQVNYQKPKLDLFQNMAFVLMQQTSTLNILRDAGLCFEPPPDWPSWIPDWSSPKSLSALSTKDCGWAACANTYGNFGVETISLLVKGVKIDSIPADGLGESRDPESTANENTFRPMSSLISSWAKTLNLPPPRSPQPRYVNGIRASEAFYRTVAVNIKYTAHKDSFTERPLEETDIQQDLDIDSWAELGVGPSEQNVDGPVQLADRVPLMGTNRVFRTSKGYFGNGTKYIEPGDEVFVVQGSKFPLVLRPIESGASHVSSYRLVEVCYVHGIMHGEGFDEALLSEIRIV